MRKWKMTAAFILMFVVAAVTAGCGAGGKEPAEREHRGVVGSGRDGVLRRGVRAGS